MKMKQIKLAVTKMGDKTNVLHSCPSVDSAYENIYSIFTLFR